MKKYIDRSLSYEEYIDLIDRLLAEKKTTGPNQSEEMTHYAKLNRQRMKRLSGTIDLDDETKRAASSLKRKMIWLIITEGWCGDAAQNIPVIEKIAAAGDNIETRYILRDENPELIDRFLTNGARSIPKLIALDAATLTVLGTWGARPSEAQMFYQKLKEEKLAKPLIMENLQRWYNSDGSRSLQLEFQRLIREWEDVLSAAQAKA
jgi:hypothetical protein